MSTNVAAVTSATAAEREERRESATTARRVERCYSALLEVQTPERRERQSDRLIESVRGRGFRVDAAVVADVAAAVNRGVAVQELGVVTLLRHADAVLGARNRREVEHHDEVLAAVARVAHHRDDAVLVVVAVDPAEARGLEVDLMEGALRLVMPVEILYEAAQRRVRRIVEQMPIEAAIVVPLAPLAELAAH